MVENKHTERKSLANVENFKYTPINVGGYSNKTAETSRIRYGGDE